MTKIGYDQVKPATAPQGKIPPAIDRSLQGAPGSQPSEQTTVKQETEAPANVQDNTASASTPASTVSPTVSPTAPDYKADLIGYDNQIGILKKERAEYDKANETEEQRKKRENREKAKRVIAAVGDGIRALSNLYFTSQYAPSMYNPNDSQLAKTDARQEKLKAEREANRDKYLNYSLRIGDLQNDRAKTVREIEAQAERIRLARERAKREQEQHQWLADLQPDKKREQTAKADAADSIAKSKRAEADNAYAIQRAKLNTEQQRGRTEQTKQTVNSATAKLRGAQVVESGARAANQRAGATAHYAAAGASNRSNVSEFSAYDSKGREHKFRTKDAAEAYAKQHGTFRQENKTERTTATGKDKLGHNAVRTSTKTSSGGGYPQNPKKKFSSFSIHK
ncbi:MAG: hypothetical protein ACFNTB_02815 [Prevotella denticola]